MTGESLNELVQRERRFQRLWMAVTILIVAIAAFAARSERTLFDFGLPSPSAFAIIQDEPDFADILRAPFARRFPVTLRRITDVGSRPTIAGLDEVPALFTGASDYPVSTGPIDLGSFALDEVPTLSRVPGPAGLPDISSQALSAAPEPAMWLLMIFGFGMIGQATRRNNSAVRAAI